MKSLSVCLCLFLLLGGEVQQVDFLQLPRLVAELVFQNDP